MKNLPMQALVLTLPLAVLFAAHGQPLQQQQRMLGEVPVPQLERTYLRCAEISTQSVMDAGDAVYCAMVADALRDRAFDGSFERLLAWWHAERGRTGLSESRAEDLPTSALAR